MRGHPRASSTTSTAPNSAGSSQSEISTQGPSEKGRHHPSTQALDFRLHVGNLATAGRAHPWRSRAANDLVAGRCPLREAGRVLDAPRRPPLHTLKGSRPRPYLGCAGHANSPSIPWYRTGTSIDWALSERFFSRAPVPFSSRHSFALPSEEGQHSQRRPASRRHALFAPCLACGRAAAAARAPPARSVPGPRSRGDTRCHRGNDGR